MLDMAGLVDYCDMFVLCSANNGRQVEAIADEVRRVAKGHGVKNITVEGKDGATWVLVDLGDVVFHVFDGPWRGFYDLDGLWSDAPRTELTDGELEDELTDEHFFSFS